MATITPTEPKHKLANVTPAEADRLWTQTDAAYLLRCTVRTIENYRRQGRFPKPTHFVGKRPRWTYAELVAFARTLPEEGV